MEPSGSVESAEAVVMGCTGGPTVRDPLTAGLAPPAVTKTLVLAGLPLSHSWKTPYGDVTLGALLVLLLAWLLARHAPTPLRFHHWLLLGLGFAC